MLGNATMASVEPQAGPLKVEIPYVLQICHRQTKSNISKSKSGFLSIMHCSDNFRGLRNTLPVILTQKIRQNNMEIDCL